MVVDVVRLGVNGCIQCIITLFPARAFGNEDVQEMNRGVADVDVERKTVVCRA